MSLYKGKAAVSDLSVGADKEQPISNNSIQSISDDSNAVNMIDENSEEILHQIRQMNHPYYLHTVSVSKLYDSVFKPKMPVIENLLYGGTYLFVGAPKVGKSFFMAQLAYHVSMGMNLWDYKVHQGTVLYLALEDDYERLQKRLFRMFGANENGNLHLATYSNQLNDGLDKKLEYFMSHHPDTLLIIIDTLQKVRDMDGSKFSYASDYDIVTKLKKFSDNNGICLLLVHHTRKQAAEDCFETISGTNGLLGAADGAFVLQKAKRTDLRAVLDIVGRDQQDQRLHLLFDQERCIWLLTKVETELWQEPSDPILESISALVNDDIKEWAGSATELIDKLGLDIQPNALTRRMNVNADRLINEYRISYESSRNHAGRQIKFTLIDEQA